MLTYWYGFFFHFLKKLKSVRPLTTAVVPKKKEYSLYFEGVFQGLSKLALVAGTGYNYSSSPPSKLGTILSI